MKDMPIPEIKIIKNKIPIIYLDTNALIEFSRYEKGYHTNEHIDKIGTLYDILLALMQEKRVLCALGNQLEEMGTSQEREAARSFLFRFTNAELKTPSQIQKMQLKSGYQAFVKNDSTSIFSVSDIVEKSKYMSTSSIDVHVVPVYSAEQLKKLKQDKEDLAVTLNDVKNSKRVAENYDSQLKLELEADFQVFLHILECYNDSPDGYLNMLDALGTVYQRVGVDPRNVSHSDIIKAVNSHNQFLLSSYHHKLPYVWTCSVLFAHIMQRQNKIIKSDNLDITWASAYLPFVDYAVTDTAFCNLLNQLGLAEQYGTKVYCFKTLNELLEELKTKAMF